MALELIPLCNVRATLSPLMVGPTSSGTRVVYEVIEGEITGDRIRAKSVSAGADWILIGPEATGMLDVRFTAETDDGAVVYIQYNGRTDVSNGAGAAPIYVAPRFETGDERYAWLNKIQAVGKGTLDAEANVVTYEWYELR